ncbi:MAG: peptidase, partial [Mycobacterium sp.]|nr:peptidase [Mycobacterium sp.]
MLLDLALLPIRIARHLVDMVAHTVTPTPAPPGDLVVVDGMPEGAPAAARRPEPSLPAPAGWPFGEAFPRTCGAGRLAGGAMFWTDFLYDDHGATGLPVGYLKIQAPPRGTYVYPDGPAAGNGADIFRTAVGLTDTDTWWRVDWNTLVDASVPIALFTFDTGRGADASEVWPAGAGVRSAGIDMALLVSGAGAQLIDLATGVSTPLGHSVDMHSRSFLARVPRSVLEPAGTWTVRL